MFMSLFSYLYWYLPYLYVFCSYLYALFFISFLLFGHIVMVCVHIFMSLFPIFAFVSCMHRAFRSVCFVVLLSHSPPFFVASELRSEVHPVCPLSLTTSHPQCHSEGPLCEDCRHRSMGLGARQAHLSNRLDIPHEVLIGVCQDDWRGVLVWHQGP